MRYSHDRPWGHQKHSKDILHVNLTIGWTDAVHWKHRLVLLTKKKKTGYSSLGIPVTTKNIEIIVLKCSKKSLDPHALSGIPCQIFKLELIPIFCQIIKDKRTFSNSFYEVSVILILKPDKDSAKKKKEK